MTTSKKLKLKMSEPIRCLMTRMIEEKRQQRETLASTAAASTTSLAPPLPLPHGPSPPQTIPRRPLHTVYRHKRLLAALSFTDQGFTLTNGVTSISHQFAGPKTFTPHPVIREVVRMRVRKLCCYDSNSYDSWKAAKKRAEENQSLDSIETLLLTKLKVILIRPFEKSRCCFCFDNTCPIWNASATLSHLLRIPFNPRPHEAHPPPIPAALVPKGEPDSSSHSSEGRTVYYHTKTAAVLCIQKDGWTLSDGVTSISYDGGQNQSLLARQIIKNNVKVLNCTDRTTQRKWQDIAVSWPTFFENVQVYLLPPTGMRICLYCSNKNCHRWKASVGFCERYARRDILDPVVHSPTTQREEKSQLLKRKSHGSVKHDNKKRMRSGIQSHRKM